MSYAETSNTTMNSKIQTDISKLASIQIIYTKTKIIFIKLKISQMIKTRSEISVYIIRSSGISIGEDF